MLSEDRLNKISAAYGIAGELVGAEDFGNGHINDTILLRYSIGGTEKKLVLQKINKYVFHRPDELMQNTIAITEHIRRKVIAVGGDPEREVVNVVYTANGDAFFIDEDGEYWRITRYIDNTVSIETVSTAEQFYETGRAFGNFQSQLSDFPAETLYYTIPEFHDTRARFGYFKKVLAEDAMNRAATCADEIAFFLGREDLAVYLMDGYDRGEFPLRVTHNDTKLNNLMIDTDTGKAVCVIDLDTVMPGFAMTDFGDAIRCGTCTAREDERDVSKVRCDLELYDAFTHGFIDGCAGKLTPHEIEILPKGAVCIAYELAMRFLTDYLLGDLYFKTDYPEHNLVRARTQIQMVHELEANADAINAIIGKYK